MSKKRKANDIEIVPLGDGLEVCDRCQHVLYVFLAAAKLAGMPDERAEAIYEDVFAHLRSYPDPTGIAASILESAFRLIVSPPTTPK